MRFSGRCAETDVDKKKHSVEEILERLIARGLLEFPLTDQTVAALESVIPEEKLTADQESLLYRAARAAHQDALIARARSVVPMADCTFGQLIKRLRAEINLHTEIADRIGISFATLRSVEDDVTNPIELPVAKLCGFMKTFSVTLTEFVRTAQQSLLLFDSRQGAHGALARSPLTAGDSARGQIAQEALDKLLVSANRGRSAPVVDSKLIDALKNQLEAEGRADLLK